ncbi:Arabinanase/levansucrase/invertase [Aureobasidium pullulans]|uniref:Arabinanase/levansucrase/invertase n=1 Tax=Aureobasidium pullulans TaxID=5580 RepID=A0A4S9SVX3_AURPU|nr:Arabinanase/levansucrase/invertase [Aureobasidium pullulans]
MSILDLPNMLSTTFTLLAGVLLSSAAPVDKRSTSGAVITVDFPDPALVKANNQWYAFGTQSTFDNKNIHIQVASSSDFNSWSLHNGQDALPNLPGWVDQSNPLVWAPDIMHLDDGTFVMYFSATTNTGGDGKYHCIGTAISSNVEGPYNPSPNPWYCPVDQGGAIDAAGFRDADGTWYITYKIDGNAKGNGGICNNGNAPIVNTPIMIQKVGSDGISKQGSPSTIMNLQGSDGPDTEAPAMVRRGNTYILMFSSHCYSTSSYDTLYATSGSPTGGFVRRGSIVGGGRGGLDASLDATHVAFHGLQGDGRRYMYTGTLNIDGTTVAI